MAMLYTTDQPYSICVIDIGSPKLRNIGWSVFDPKTQAFQNGVELDEIVPLIAEQLKLRGVILGLEAPLFVPLRDDLMLATKARKGEGRRPWSAGAGAQVLTMNLPIMTYLLRKLKAACSGIEVFVNEDGFNAHAGQIMIFEALVSGSDKGQSHIDDAQIMVKYCVPFSNKCYLPLSILEEEVGAEFLNLTAASLLRCGLTTDVKKLNCYSPIYKPSHDSL
jgi:hypothetical protein